MTLLERLAGLRLIVVTGKGGVGKSTLTVALGQILSRAGRRVLLLEVDPRESLYHLLDVDPGGGAIVRVEPRLHVQNLRPRDVLDRLVRERVRIGLLVHRLLASAAYRQFAEAAPGLKELAVLGHALRLIRGLGGRDAPDLDTVILDAPATGHALSLLAGPLLVSDVIREGPFGEMAAELAAFIGDPTQCGVTVITLAEEMPTREAVELIDGLAERLHRRPELLVVNGLYPATQGIPGDSGERWSELESLWRRRRQINDEQLDRLGRAWCGPRIDLPLLAHTRGPGLLSAVRPALERGLAHQPRGDST